MQIRNIYAIEDKGQRTKTHSCLINFLSGSLHDNDCLARGKASQQQHAAHLSVDAEGQQSKDDALRCLVNPTIFNPDGSNTHKI